MIVYRQGKPVQEGSVDQLELEPKRTAVQWEHYEQVRLFRWARLQEGRFPCLAYLHASMVGTKAKNRRQAARRKAAGMRAGVPDVCLPYPSGRFHGLYLELKRPKGPGRERGRLSVDQARWIAWLNEHGYMAVVAYGWEEAAALIVEYLEGKGDRCPREG